MLVDQGLHRAMEDLPRAELSPVLCTILLLLSEAQWQAYYNDQPQWRRTWQNLRDNCWHMKLPASHLYHLPPTPGLTSIPHDQPTPPPQLDPSPPTPPLRPASRTSRPLTTPNPSPFPLGPIQALLWGNITRQTTLQHTTAGDTLAIEELPTWLLGELLSPEDWKWCLVQAPDPTLSLSLPPCWTPPPSTSDVMCVMSNMSVPIALTIIAPSAMDSPLDTHSMLSPAVFASYVENIDTKMWIVHPQPLWVYPDLPLGVLEWVLGLLKLESQEYEGGNVMVMEDSISVSFFPLFSPTFSFANLPKYAFPDAHID